MALRLSITDRTTPFLINEACNRETDRCGDGGHVLYYKCCYEFELQASLIFMIVPLYIIQIATSIAR